MFDTEKKVKIAYEEIAEMGAYLYESYDDAPLLKGINYCLNVLEYYFPELRSEEE